MKEILKRNLLFIFIIILFIVILLMKDKSIHIPIVSEPDSQLELTTGERMEQSWQPIVKNIGQITIPYEATTDFEGTLQLDFLTEDGTVLANAQIHQTFAANENGNLLFDLEVLKVSPGTRYYISLYYQNFSSPGSILLDSGSNYTGCTVDDLSMDEALAFTVTGTKVGAISWLALAFFPFMSFTLLFMILWNRKFEETIGLSVIIAVCILCLMGMFGNLEAGIFILYALAVIAFIIAIVYFNYKRLIWKDLFSPGLIIYCFLIGAILINCDGLFLSRADEFTHWGLSAKDMFFSNSLNKHMETTIQTYYPPFMPVLEYFLVYLNGLFADKYLYIGYQIVLISLLCVLLKNCFGKNWKWCLPAITIIVSMPIMFYADVFSTLYTDAVLAIMVAYVLFSYFSEKISLYSESCIVAGMFALIFTKPTGIVFAGLIALIIFGDILFKQYKIKHFKAKEYLFPTVALVICVVCFWGWQVYCNAPIKATQGAETQIEEISVIETHGIGDITKNSGITAEKIMNLIGQNGEPYQYKTIENFVKSIIIDKAYRVGNTAYSYMGVLLLSLIISWLVTRLICKRDGEESLILFGTLTFVAGLAYAGFLLVTYLFSFTEAEALTLAHSARYLASWIGGIIIALLALTMMRTIQESNSDNATVYTKNIVYFVLVALLTIAPFENIVTRRSDTYAMSHYAYSYEDMLETSRSFIDNSDKIFFICEDTEGLDYAMFKYAVCPVRTKNGLLDDMTPNELAEELTEYQYVFILHTGEAFGETFGEVFENPDTICDGTFYQVVKKENQILLHYIGVTGAKKYSAGE